MIRPGDVAHGYGSHEHPLAGHRVLACLPVRAVQQLCHIALTG